MLKVCYSIAEDPPNDDIPSYELYSKVKNSIVHIQIVPILIPSLF